MNIKYVTGALKEKILNGRVHTVDEMSVWLLPWGYSGAINDVAVGKIRAYI